jgi:hypothetical protein
MLTSIPNQRRGPARRWRWQETLSASAERPSRLGIVVAGRRTTSQMSTRPKLTEGEKRMFEVWLNVKLRNGVKLKQARADCWKAILAWRENHAASMRVRG